MESYKEEDLMSLICSDSLAHYGIKGQKWGDRRFQNEDGSLTPEGKIRYGIKYSMTDKELFEAVKNAENRNRYISMRTEPSRKKKESIKELIKTSASTGANITDLRSNYEQSRLDPKADKERINELKSDVDLSKKIKTASEKGGASAIAGIATKSEYTREKEEAIRNLSEMSPDELDQIVKRMDLEKRYDELVNPPKKSVIDIGRETIQILGAGAAFALTILEIKNLLGKKNVAHSDTLAHYGVKGMKKGQRRYQNEDGSLTPEGYRHYGIDPNAGSRQASSELAKIQRDEYEYQKEIRRYRDEQKISRQERKADFKQERKEAQTKRKDTRKNFFKYVAGTAAVVGAVAIGASIIKNINLDKQHLRDMDKLALEGRNALNLKKQEEGTKRYLGKLSYKTAKSADETKQLPEKLKFKSYNTEEGTKRYLGKLSYKTAKSADETKQLPEKLKYAFSKDENFTKRYESWLNNKRETSKTKQSLQEILRAQAEKERKYAKAKETREKNKEKRRIAEAAQVGTEVLEFVFSGKGKVKGK